MAKERRTSTAEQKAAIFRRHLIHGVPVSDLCEGHGINPTVFFRWQKTLLGNAAQAFGRRTDARERSLQQKLDHVDFKHVRLVCSFRASQDPFCHDTRQASQSVAGCGRQAPR